MKRVEIIWMDAMFRMEDHSRKSVKKLRPMQTHSVGYLASRDDECINICQTRDKDKSRSEILTIPIKMIVEIRELVAL